MRGEARTGPAGSAASAWVDLSAGPVEFFDSGGEGPVLLLCHGLLMDQSVWDPVVQHLGGDWRVVRPILPFGAHQRPMRSNADLTLTGHVALLEEFLEKLDLSEVVLVVSDLGYPLLLASRSNPRLTGLVVLSCEAFDNIPPGLPGKTVALAARVPGGLRLASASLMLPRLDRLPFTLGGLSRSPVPRSMLRAWMRPTLRQSAVARDLRRYALAPDHHVLGESMEALADFDRPSLVIWSESDRVMPPSHATRLSQLLPNSELTWVPDGRVLLQLDEPARVAALIDAFRTRVTSSRKQ